MTYLKKLTAVLVLGAVVFGASVVGMVAAAEAARPEDKRGADRVTREEVRLIVVQESLRSELVPPSLALAVAHAESHFDPSAESSAGARGVMQIMPATGRGEFGVEPDELWEPRLNAQLGIAFLDQLIDRYDGRWDLALSYYNGGSRVGNGATAKVIPATQSYVDKVLKLERRYAGDDRTEAMVAEAQIGNSTLPGAVSRSDRRITLAALRADIRDDMRRDVAREMRRSNKTLTRLEALEAQAGRDAADHASFPELEMARSETRRHVQSSARDHANRSSGFGHGLGHGLGHGRGHDHGGRRYGERLYGDRLYGDRALPSRHARVDEAPRSRTFERTHTSSDRAHQHGSERGYGDRRDQGRGSSLFSRTGGSDGLLDAIETRKARFRSLIDG